jgi:subtilisin family serine protease
MGDSSKLTLDLAGLTSSGTATGIASYGSRSGTPAPTFTTVERINNPSGFFACLTYGATSLDVTIQSGACFQWASADPNTQEIRISDILPAATRAWAATAHSVTVASLDSGIDYTHPALSRNVWINQGEIPADVRARLRDRHGDGRITLRDLNLTMNQGPGRISDLNGNGFVDGGDLLQAWSDDQDDDGNGYVDDIIGWDFVNNDNDPMDDSGHGTYGAGILTQVAPRAEILPLKFLDSNAVGSLSDAARALDYALAKGVSISSNGWAASVFSQEWLDELEKAEAAGHLFVTAAGNGDPALLRILSRLHLSNVLVVTTTGANGRLASFSNRDPEIVDLAAPGVGVLSTIPGGGYAAHSGTSVSTAYVAGIAALLRGGRPHVGRADVVDAILASSSQASSLTEAPGGGHPSLLGVIATDFRSSSQELQNALPYSVDDDSIPLSAYQPTLFSPVLRRKLFGRNAPVGSNLWLAFESAPGF